MTKYEYTIGKEMDLKKEQEITLAAPRLKSNLILKMMFLTMDILYGSKRTLPKFKVIEILARYPYWAWENGGYLRLTKLYTKKRKDIEKKTEDFCHFIDIGREAQDNEQSHMLLLEDIIQKEGIKLGWFNHYFLPRVLAGTYYVLTRMMFSMNPKWSFAMNAAFESHAEHEYMLLAKENPEWDSKEIDSIYFKNYPRQKTLGDHLRRIGLDERDHMNRSLEQIEKLTKPINSHKKTARFCRTEPCSVTTPHGGVLQRIRPIF